MKNTEFEDMVEGMFCDLSLPEIEKEFKEILSIIERIKRRRQVEIMTKSLLGSKFASATRDASVIVMEGGYRPSAIYCDEMPYRAAPLVMEPKSTHVMGYKISRIGITKKKTAFKGANASHQIILNNQRRKKK